MVRRPRRTKAGTNEERAESDGEGKGEVGKEEAEDGGDEEKKNGVEEKRLQEDKKGAEEEADVGDTVKPLEGFEVVEHDDPGVAKGQRGSTPDPKRRRVGDGPGGLPSSEKMDGPHSRLGANSLCASPARQTATGKAPGKEMRQTKEAPADRRKELQARREELKLELTHKIDEQDFLAANTLKDKLKEVDKELQAYMKTQVDAHSQRVEKLETRSQELRAEMLRAGAAHDFEAAKR